MSGSKNKHVVINEKLHKELKILATKDEKSIKDFLESFLKKTLKNRE